MRKLYLAALIIGVCAPSIMAQEPAKAGIYGDPPHQLFKALGTSDQEAEDNSRGAQDRARRRRRCPPICPRSGHNHVEIYGGYSFLLLEGFRATSADFNDVLDERIYFHGGDLSGTFNFSRYVGAQFDFSLHKRSEDLDQFGVAGDAEANIQHYLF